MTYSKSLVELILPILVIVLSLVNLSNNIGDFVSLSVLVSFIGIAGAILSFVGKPIATTLIYIWIYAQVIIIEPVFNLSQGLSFAFGLNFDSSGTVTAFNINILPLLLLSLVKILQSVNLVGKEIQFSEFRESVLGDVFPMKGVVMERISIAGENDWLLVNILDPIHYDSKMVYKVLVRRKDGKTIKLKSKESQLVYFRLVLDSNDLNYTSDLTRFPFVEWVYCN